MIDVDVFETCAAAGKGPSVILANYKAVFLTVVKIISHVGTSKPSAAPWLSPLEFSREFSPSALAPYA